MNKLTEKPLLSVIIPCYNVSQYVRRTIDSLLANDYPAKQLILVDDGSTDDTLAILHEYAAKYRFIEVVTKPNGGVSSARNAGLDHARGEYVTFVDSDDYVAPGTFVENMAVIEANPEIDILEYPMYVYYGGRRAEKYVPKSDTSCGATAFDCWVSRKGYYRCYSCNKIFKRNLWEGIRFPERRYYEDIFTIPKVVEKAALMECSGKGIYYYCDRVGSISNTGSEKVLFDFVSAELELWERLRKSFCFSTLSSDEFYLTVCNWQADLLCKGGQDVSLHKTGFRGRANCYADLGNPKFRQALP